MNQNNIYKKDIIAYFNECKNKYKKAVGIISSKQHILYVDEISDESETHDDIATNINKHIYNINSLINYQSSNIYYFSSGKDITAYIPDEISISQYIFLSELLKKIFDYNDKSNKKIELIIPKLDIDGTTNYNDALQQLRSITTNNEILQEEKILGETLPEETIRQNIKNICKLDKCTNIETLKIAMIELIHYYKDRYYSRYIRELFPNIDLIASSHIIMPTDIEKINEINNRLKNTNNLDNLFKIMLEIVAESLKKEIETTDKMIYMYKEINERKFTRNQQRYLEENRRYKKQLERITNYNRELEEMFKENEKTHNEKSMNK